MMGLLTNRRSISTGIDGNLPAATPLARLERSPRGSVRLIVDGGREELRISLPAGQEWAVLDRLRADLDGMREGAV